MFVNETVRDYCLAEGIVFTRCGPYRKNDQAHIEQKNGAIVRRIVGYRRFEGMAAARVLADLYARTRLFVNAFQPSFKLAGKERDGAQVRKRYHPPATPCDRLLADPRTSEVVRARVEALRADLDPVRLLADIRNAQRTLEAISDQIAASPPDASTERVPVADFLASCERHGRWAKSDRLRSRRRNPNVAAVVRTRWSPSPTNCTAGSRPTRRKRELNYSRACRHRIPIPIRTACSARSSVVSESGEVKLHPSLCSGLRAASLRRRLREHQCEATGQSLGSILR